MEPLLQKSDAGRAVFITSGIASKATAYMGPYAASKAALDALVRVWANEMINTPIRVNLFSPGPIRTRMRATVMPGEDPHDARHAGAGCGIHRADVSAVMARDRKVLRLSV
jgi:NAD(P)-dependent dehydrogenase (short-subunit alcohol dehydrogenase family)